MRALKDPMMNEKQSLLNRQERQHSSILPHIVFQFLSASEVGFLESWFHLFFVFFNFFFFLSVCFLVIYKFLAFVIMYMNEC